MIKAHFDVFEDKFELEAKGSNAMLFSDTIMIVKKVYEGIKEQNPERAEEYKKSMIKDIESAFMSRGEMEDYAMERLLKKRLLETLLRGIKEHNNDELIRELKDLKKSENE